MESAFERKLEIKYAVVSAICRSKQILFAETSEHITKRDKMNKWQEIFEHSMAIGGATATRSWSYLRDVYWPNVKRSTMTKVNRQGLLSKIDLIVLDILNLKKDGQKHGDKLKIEIQKLERKLGARQTRSKCSLDETISIDENLLPIKQESISLPTSPVPSSHHDDENDDQHDYLYQFNDEHLLPNNLETSNALMELDAPNQYNNNEQVDGFKRIKLTMKPSPPPTPSPSSSSTTTPLTTNMKDDISILRKRKLEEQVEFLKLQNVKARLEIKEAEIRVLLLEKDLELKNAQVAEILK